MTPNFEYYKIFYYAAKYKNFTLAAKVLLTSQPSVTRSIKSLEHDLGCRLFVRSKRGASLTPEGKLLYSHISAACDFIFKGEEALSEVLSLREGSVYIGATETSIRCFLLDKLKMFHNAFPQIGIKIISNSTMNVIDELEAGKIDFAAVTTPVEANGYLRVTKVKLFRDILIAGRDFAYLADRELSLEDLKKYPLVGLSEDTMTHKFHSEFYAEHGVRFLPDIEMADADLLLPIISNNLGIGFVPDDMAEESIRRGEIVKLHLKEKLPDRYICVIQDMQRPLNASARKLLKLLHSDTALGTVSEPE